MNRWQRRLRTGIAVFGLGFAAVVFVAVRNSKKPEDSNQAVGRVDRTAAAEGRGVEVRNLGVQGEKLKVEAENQLAYADGRMKLAGNVRITVPPRGGRALQIKGREAEIGPNQENLVMRGAVGMTSSDGLKANAEEASFNQKEGILRAPGPFSFTRGGLTGTSVGMAYDQNRDIITFLDHAILKQLPQKPGEAAVDIAAGWASLARRDHFARFERNFRLVNGTRVLESDTATAYLTDDDARVTSLEMRVHSRISGLGEGAGAVRGMQADEINLEFAPDGRTLQGAALAHNAAIDLAGADGGGRRITAEWIDVKLAPDGTTVSGLTAREHLVLTLPATTDEPARVITANTMTGKGEPGKGLNAVRFTENVEFRETRPAEKGKDTTRKVTGRALDLATQPGFGELEEARFSGAVRFEEDTMHSASGAARYFVKRGAVRLDGVDDSTGRIPRVQDNQVTIDGRRIEMTLEKRQITATQDVRSVMLAASDQSGAGDTSMKRAGMLKQDQPVYATSDSMTYDGNVRLAIYTKDARLWQGDTAISGDSVTVDDATGNLASKGHVRSTMMLEQTDEKTKKVDHAQTIASAEEMVYEDAPHRATYTGSAHVAGPQGDLHGNKIEMYLKPSGNELDRVEAYTHVSTQDPARYATGERLTYFADEERYLMTGSPVKICADFRESTGRILTFFKSTNTITLDGNEDTRTQTKGGAKCGEPRR